MVESEIIFRSVNDSGTINMCFYFGEYCLVCDIDLVD